VIDAAEGGKSVMVSNARILIAEFVGTAVLMMGGPGSAILAGDRIGTTGVAVAFGLSLLIMAYVIGPVSGCHINPAVTVAMALTRKIKAASAAFYIVGQLAGAAFGGLIIYAIAKGEDGFDATNNFAANGWGDKIVGNPYGIGAVALVEIVFTGLLVFVVLTTTNKGFTAAMGGLTAGVTLTLIHLITIPVDNTSVNPARSFGAAIFSGSDAWSQIWAFIVFPIVGALLGVIVWLAVSDETLEDTMLATRTTMEMRDKLDSAADKVVAAAERVVD
jgi:aquaporin Z